jgi:hypothetical protein
MPSPRKTTYGGLSDPINVHHGELQYQQKLQEELQYQQKLQEELQEPLNATFPLRLPQLLYVPPPPLLPPGAEARTEGWRAAGRGEERRSRLD